MPIYEYACHKCRKFVEVITRRIPETEFNRFVDRIYCRKTDPYSAADRLLAALKKELRAKHRPK